MSKIALKPNDSGTGTFTLESPNSNTDRTFVLPDSTGDLLTTTSSLDAGKLTGALPAIDGSSLTGVAPLYFVENVQTGNYTLALSDVAKVVAMDNSSAATVTVPSNSSVAFPVGTVINVYAMTANTVTIAAESGVTVRNSGDISDQYVEVSLRKRDTDEWVLSGGVA